MFSYKKILQDRLAKAVEENDIKKAKQVLNTTIVSKDDDGGNNSDNEKPFETLVGLLDTSSKYSLLGAAVTSSKNLAICNLLIDYEKNSAKNGNLQGLLLERRSDRTPLDRAVTSGCFQIVAMLLHSGYAREQLDAKDEETESTVLHRALKKSSSNNCDLRTIKLLIGLGANLDTCKNKEGKTALDMFGTAAAAAAAAATTAAAADEDDDDDDDGDEDASSSTSSAVTSSTVSSDLVSVNNSTTSNNTNKDAEAKRNFLCQEASAIVQQSINWYKSDDDTSGFRHTLLGEELFSAVKTRKEGDERKKTTDIADILNRDECRKSIKSLANVVRESDGLTLLHLVANLGDLDSCRHIIEFEKNRGGGGGDLSALLLTNDDNISPPIQYAANDNHFEIVALLLEQGFVHEQLSAKDKDGDTALHYAASFGYMTCAQILLAFGADVSEKNNNKLTPGEFALQRLQIRMHRFLTETSPEQLQTASLEWYKNDGGFSTAVNAPRLKAAIEAEDFSKVEEILMLKPNNNNNNNAAVSPFASLTSLEKEFGGRSPLHVASVACSVEICGALIEYEKNKAKDGDLKKLVVATDHQSYVALHYAVARNNFEVVKLLLDQGFVDEQLTAKDKDGDTPLHLAANNESVDAAKVLIGHGADIKAKNNKGDTVFDIATTNTSDDVDTGLLAVISSKRDTAALKKQCADWCASSEFSSSVKEKKLLRACKTERVAHVKNILFGDDTATASSSSSDDDRDDDNNLNNNNNTTTPPFPTLVNVIDSNNFCPFHHAVVNGNVDICRLLVRYEKRRAPKKDLEKLLLGSRVVTLHLAVTSNYYKTADFLLRQGFVSKQLNQATSYLVTPLHFAAEYGALESALVLIAYGADVNAETHEGQTPLDIARSSNNSELEALLSQFMEVSEERQELLERQCVEWYKNEFPDVFLLSLIFQKLVAACEANDVSMVKKILANKPFDTLTKSYESIEWTALHYAAYNGHLQVCDALIEYERDQAPKGNLKSLLLSKDHVLQNSPLHYAASRNQFAVINFLLDIDTDLAKQQLEATNKRGGTALHAAAELQFSESVKVLIAFGSNLSATDLDHKTPLDSARSGSIDSSSIVSFLRQDEESIRRQSIRWCNDDVAGFELAALTKHLIDAVQRQDHTGPSGHRIEQSLLASNFITLADIRDPTENKSSLHIAADNGDLQLCQLLLTYEAHRAEKGNVGNLLLAKDSEGQTALHLVAKSNNFELASCLLQQQDFALNNDKLLLAKDDEGRTPLHICAQHGYLETARVLIAYASSSSETGGDSSTSVASLLEAKENEKKTPREIADSNYERDLEAFLSDTAEKIKQQSVKWYKGSTGFVSILRMKKLFDAISKQKTSEVKELLRESKFETLNVVMPNKESPLEFAVRIGNVKICRLLMDYERRNASNGSIEELLLSRGLLSGAVYENHPEIVSLLLQAGFVKEQLKMKSSPSGERSGSSSTNYIERLLFGLSNHTPIVQAAKKGHLNCMKVLVAFGADLNSTGDSLYDTALEAAQRGFRTNNEMVYFLQQDEGKIFEQSIEWFRRKYGCLAKTVVAKEFLQAVEFNECKKVEEMLKKKPFSSLSSVLDSRHQMWNPLHHAAHKGDLEMCKILVQFESENSRASRGRMFSFLLGDSSSSDENGEQDGRGNRLGDGGDDSSSSRTHYHHHHLENKRCWITPLHLTARWNHCEVADFILKQSLLAYLRVDPILRHALLNARDPKGNTPLHLAAFYGALECAKLFIALGADVASKNARNETPLDRAKISTKKTEMVKLLSIYAPVADDGNNNRSKDMIDDKKSDDKNDDDDDNDDGNEKKMTPEKKLKEECEEWLTEWRKNNKSKKKQQQRNNDKNNSKASSAESSDSDDSDSPTDGKRLLKLLQLFALKAALENN